MVNQADPGVSVRIRGDNALDIAVVEFPEMLGQHGAVDSRPVHCRRNIFNGQVFADSAVCVRVNDHDRPSVCRNVFRIGCGSLVGKRRSGGKSVASEAKKEKPMQQMEEIRYSTTDERMGVD